MVGSAADVGLLGVDLHGFRGHQDPASRRRSEIRQCRQRVQEHDGRDGADAERGEGHQR